METCHIQSVTIRLVILSLSPSRWWLGFGSDRWQQNSFPVFLREFWCVVVKDFPTRWQLAVGTATFSTFWKLWHDRTSLQSTPRSDLYLFSLFFLWTRHFGESLLVSECSHRKLFWLHEDIFWVGRFIALEWPQSASTIKLWAELQVTIREHALDKLFHSLGSRLFFFPE